MKTATRVWGLLTVLLLVWAAEARAQGGFVRLQIDRTTDTISSNGDSVELVARDVGGFGAVKVQTLDSYSGTWEVQCAVNGTAYDTSAELRLKPTDGGAEVTSVVDSVGIWDVVNAGGCNAIKVIATAGFAASDTSVVIAATQTGSGYSGLDAVDSQALASIESASESTANLLDSVITGSSADVNIVAVNGAAPYFSPCELEAWTPYVVDIVTAATTEVMGVPVSTDKVYLCMVHLFAGAANNVTLVEDDTDNCASPTAGFFGGVTAAEGWNFVANQGVQLSNGGKSVGQTAAVNRYVCLITSANVQLSGLIYYVLAP